MLNLLKVNTKFYGSNSLCVQSISEWNMFQQLFPNTELANLSASKIKSLVTSYFIQSYT